MLFNALVASALATSALALPHIKRSVIHSTWPGSCPGGNCYPIPTSCTESASSTSTSSSCTESASHTATPTYCEGSASCPPTSSSCTESASHTATPTYCEGSASCPPTSTSTSTSSSCAGSENCQPTPTPLSCTGSESCTTSGCTGSTYCPQTTTCDSTDPLVCPQSSCDGISNTKSCDPTNTTDSNHMPGGPHMPTFSHLPIPQSGDDMPTCGSDSWVMGTPCDCPAGTYMQSSTTTATWPVPASDMTNMTGDFWSTSWFGAETYGTMGTGNGTTPGDMRVFMSPLPGVDKGSLITEKLAKYQKNADGGYSMMFGFADIPMTYQEDDGTWGQIGASWDTMSVCAMGPDACEMTWQTNACFSDHTDLSGFHESAMINVTAILQAQGNLPSDVLPTNMSSV